MSFAEVRQRLLHDFVVCVEHQRLPPLGAYLAKFVRPGSSVVPEEYRLLPMTASALRFVNSGSQCVTDCLLELQCKYQQFIPDAWGGRSEKGSREVGVIGFNIRPRGRREAALPNEAVGDGTGPAGPVLDIQEISPTGSYLAWAQAKLQTLAWERLLIQAVVDFGRSCGAQEVRLQPATGQSHAPGPCDSPHPAEDRQGLEHRCDDDARALGFVFDEAQGCFVLTLSESTP